MGYGGTVADMISRWKYNKALRSAYRDRQEKLQEAISRAYGKHHDLDLERPGISKEEMEKSKKEIRNQIKKENKLRLMKTLVLFTIVLPVFIYVVYLIITVGLNYFKLPV